MASLSNNPEQWRLVLNGTPVKFMGVTGSFSAESGKVDATYLIKPYDMINFLIATFPPPIEIGSITVPQSSQLPGLPGLAATDVSFKALDDGRPIDPFGFDPTAPSGTYGEFVEVTVTYGLNKLQEPDSNDPTTFLEVSCDSKSDFIAAIPAASGGGVIQPETPAESAGGENIEKVPDKTTKKPQDPNIKSETVEPVESKDVMYKVRVTMTEWTLKWSQISYVYFNTVLLARLRWAEGHVNSLPMPLFGFNEPETMLLDSFRMTQQFSWRNGFVSAPPCTVEMKLVEKRFIWRGIVVTHNHLWVPGVGWSYYLIGGEYDAQGKVIKPGYPIYESRNLNALFAP